MGSFIGPLEEIELWVPKDSNVGIAFHKVLYDYHRSEEDGFIKIDIVYGIKGLDRDDTRAFDVNDRGDVEWDDDFDLTPKANQVRMVELCSILKNSSLVQDGIVRCFMADFKNWLEATEGAGAFPTEPDQFHTKMADFRQTPIGFYHVVNDRIGYIGSEFKYCSIYAVADGAFEPYEDMFPLWEKWDDLIKDFNNNSPTGMNKSYQTSFMWQFMIKEKALSRDAVKIALLTIAISAIIFAVSSLNIILAIYVLLTFVGIIGSIFGFVFILGWDFGTVVSVAIVALIAVSVNHVVHICHGYSQSRRSTRVEKTREALGYIGISVLGGLIPSFAVGLILFATSLIFFEEFAWMISATAFFAGIWCMIFLPALLMLAGPENTQGDLKVFYLTVKKKIAKPVKQ